eukprot:GHVS01013582.1.p1 GENE.GHVS01013582.1~~GHVS01013582.1.p1  ORF type:complete len:172 (-),score=28.25 GHVS01013582.1:397-912(-)
MHFRRVLRNLFPPIRSSSIFLFLRPSSSPPLILPPEFPLRPALRFFSCSADKTYLYHKAVDEALQCCFDTLEYANIPSMEELELKDGVLRIEFISGTSSPLAFVLNKHYITQQIWYSSPVSGPYYFDFPSGWRSAKTGRTVFETLTEDVKKVCGVTVRFQSIINSSKSQSS